MNITNPAGDNHCHQILHIKYHRIPNVTAYVTFGLGRQKGPLLSSNRYFRMVTVVSDKADA